MLDLLQGILWGREAFRPIIGSKIIQPSAQIKAALLCGFSFNKNSIWLYFLLFLNWKIKMRILIKD